MRSFRLEGWYMSRRRSFPVRAWMAALAVIGVGVVATALWGAQAPATNHPGTPATTNPRAFLDTYCITCHNQKLRTAGLTLDTLDAARPR